MPDITMCNGGACPLKSHCYRYSAEESDLQSYFLEPPFKSTLMIDERDKSLGVITFACAYFWNSVGTVNVEYKKEKSK